MISILCFVFQLKPSLKSNIAQNEKMLRRRCPVESDSPYRSLFLSTFLDIVIRNADVNTDINIRGSTGFQQYCSVSQQEEPSQKYLLASKSLYKSPLSESTCTSIDEASPT